MNITSVHEEKERDFQRLATIGIMFLGYVLFNYWSFEP
jgi:hypothetical protein